MKIALDFDGTVTADPDFWSAFVEDALDRGHQVLTVTHRRDTHENRRAIEKVLGPSHPVVFAYDKPKKLAAKEAGHEPHIWIDDNPHGIGDGTENVATQSVFEIELRHALRVLKMSEDYRELPREARVMAMLVNLRERIETVVGGDA